MKNGTDTTVNGSLARPPRRTLLKGAACAALELAVLRATGFAQDDPASSRPQAGDLLVRAEDSAGTPLKVSDVSPGPPILAWAMDPTTKTIRSGSRFNQLTVLKLDEGKLAGDTKGRAAGGVVAYTIICTHSGCDATEWLADSQLLFCGCHSSSFDPKDGARVVEGPAPRNLPALPLRVADGMLVVAGGFTDRVGFDAA